MDRQQYLLLLSALLLVLHTKFGQTGTVKKKQPSTPPLASYTKDKNAATTTDDQGSKTKDTIPKIMDPYRVIPAAITIAIFVFGSLSIFFYERNKERKKRQLKGADISEEEDNELNAAWLSTLAKKNQRRGNVLERVRKFSLSIKGIQDEVDLEKQRKYKIYDEMLEKYRETLRVLRKGTKPQLGSDSKPAARLRKLAELHKQQTSDTFKSEEISEPDIAEEPEPVHDQYTLTLAMLNREAEIADSIVEEPELIEEKEEQKEDNEDAEADPVFITRRRRSSRFRKQAVVDDGSFDRPSMSRAAVLFQSYMASQEEIESPGHENPTEPIEDNSDDDLELIKVLEKSSEAELSALHRIQKRMRPKSFIETLASIHRETTNLISPRAHSMHSLAKVGSKGSLTNLGKKAVNSAGNSSENVLSTVKETASSNSPVLRAKQKPRNRPKSLHEAAVTRRKVSQTRKPKARPVSLYIQHRIQEAIPETQREIPIQIESVPLKGSKSSSNKYLDVGSLHDIPFSSMTAAEEENVIAEIEKQLIAQVCDENDLSSDEVKALERLLDDFATYSEQDSPDPKRKVEKQYSFTDSISLFGDVDQNELPEDDKSEETVLMSLKDESFPSSSKRQSYSAYDNV